MRSYYLGAILAAVVIATAARAESARVTTSASEREWTPTTVSPVGAGFAREVSTAWTALPANFRNDLAKSGWQVQLAEFVVDAAPNLAEQAPRGWPSGMSWRQSDAVHLPGERRLIVAEKRVTAAGNVVHASRTQGVLRHELGHAFDVARGNRHRYLSASPAFVAAYQQDIAQIPSEAKGQLTYYLQPGSAGRQEAFAEALAVHLGGGSDEANAALFAQSFPRVLKFAGGCLTR
jgi:hypothetical protein